MLQVEGAALFQLLLDTKVKGSPVLSFYVQALLTNLFRLMPITFPCFFLA